MRIHRQNHHNDGMLRWSQMLLALVILCAGCNQAPPMAPASSATPINPTVLLSVTSDATQDPQSVDMAMKLAGFSLDEGRHVVMFFNVKGVQIPTAALADDFAFQEHSPIKTQLADLIKRGVDVHVCPVCMKALNVRDSDLIEGAKVTTRPSLFANIGSDTAVFTY